MSHTNFKYYTDSAGEVYRVLVSDPTIAVGMTPKVQHTTVPVSSLFCGITKKLAKTIINDKWDKFVDKWEYDGKEYVASDTLLELGSLYQSENKYGGTFTSKVWHFDGKYGCHMYPSTHLDSAGNPRIQKCWCGQFQGKIVMYNPYHYTPQAFAWEYDPGNHTHCGHSIGFIPMKHIKPIYCKTDKKYLS